MGEINFKIGDITIKRDSEEVAKAIESGEEITLSSDEIKVFKTEDFETLRNNIKSEGYDEGKVVGVEMAVKKGREKYGLDFEGKNFDSFATA